MLSFRNEEEPFNSDIDSILWASDTIRLNYLSIFFEFLQWYFLFPRTIFFRLLDAIEASLFIPLDIKKEKKKRKNKIEN